MLHFNKRKNLLGRQDYQCCLISADSAAVSYDMAMEVYFKQQNLLSSTQRDLSLTLNPQSLLYLTNSTHLNQQFKSIYPQVPRLKLNCSATATKLDLEENVRHKLLKLPQKLNLSSVIVDFQETHTAGYFNTQERGVISGIKSFQAYRNLELVSYPQILPRQHVFIICLRPVNSPNLSLHLGFNSYQLNLSEGKIRQLQTASGEGFVIGNYEKA